MVVFSSSFRERSAEEGIIPRAGESTRSVGVAARDDDEFARSVKDVISEVKNVDKFLGRRFFCISVLVLENVCKVCPSACVCVNPGALCP